MNTISQEPKQTTLYYREGSSDKVYRASLEQNGSPDRFLVRFAYGRRGSTLQTGTKTDTPVDYDAALKTYNQLVASKMAKGYSPGSMGTPTEFLVPFADLHKLGKTLPPDAALVLERVADEQVLTRYRLGQRPVEQTLAVPPVADFPTEPAITAPPISLDEATRNTLLDALACASDDETRSILNGAHLDVSKPNGHYAVATDGRHLYASNSLHLPLPSSVLIPGHRFLSWGGFAKDGQWRLAVQPAIKEKGGYLLLESRRWRFVSRQVEGTYPNWRTIAEEVRDFSGTLVLGEGAAEAIQAIVPRLPGDEEPNHTVGLHTRQGRLFLGGWNPG